MPPYSMPETGVDEEGEDTQEDEEDEDVNVTGFS
jgi:hypothetical protein